MCFSLLGPPIRVHLPHPNELLNTECSIRWQICFSAVGGHLRGAGGIFPPQIQWQAASQRSLWYWSLWPGVCILLFLFWKPCSTTLCSVKSINRYRKDLGLLSTCQQKHTPQSIASAVADIQEMFLSHGRETIRKELAMWYGIRASWWAQCKATPLQHHTHSHYLLQNDNCLFGIHSHIKDGHTIIYLLIFS